MYLISNKDTIEDPCCLTPWSIIHFLLGIGFIILNLKFVQIQNFWNIFIFYNVIHLIYEIKDYNTGINYKFRETIKNILGKSIVNWSINNSIVNSVCDQVVFAIGLLLGYHLFYIKKLKILINPIIILSITLLIYFLCNNTYG